MSPISYDTSHYQKFTPPFDIPDSWEWVRLEDIAQSNIGLTYKPSDVSKDGVPVYRSNNIQNRSICKKDLVRVISEILPNQFLNEGDLLICARNGSRRLVGKNAIIHRLDEPTSFGAFMAVCRSEYNNWIHVLLNTLYFDGYLNASNSTAINQVTQKMLLDFTIPFPPVNEQVKIISSISKCLQLLDYIEKTSEEFNHAIVNAKSKILELAMQGKLVPQDLADEPAADMLRRVNPKAKIITDNPHSWNIPSNWIWISVKDVFKPMERKLPNGDQFLYIDIDSIDNKSNTVIPKTISVKTAPSRASRKTTKGDIVFSMVRPYLKNIAIVPEDECIASTGFYVLSSTTSIDPQFAFQIAISDFFVQGLNSFMKGDNSPSINKDNIEHYVIPLPPMNEQKRIVAKIEELYSCLDKIEASLQS